MTTLGLDIGGANLKAAHGSGAARSLPFALWREPDQLLTQLERLTADLPPFDRLAVSMTGEMCDCFGTRREGVAQLLDAIEALAGARPVHVWLTDGTFAPAGAARQRPMQAAAANWHALATWTARAHPHDRTLLLDTGSTTTDVVRLAGGRVTARGLTDTERLATGELVYVGATRTPLMALGSHVTWQGNPHGLMAEHFATTADIYVLTGDLPPDPACIDTADGRPLVAPCAAARVLRMVGADAETHTIDDARELATAFARAVDGRVRDAIRQVLAGRRAERVVVTGSGAFIAAGAARAILARVPVVSLDDVVDANAACAFALVRLCDG